MMEHETERKDWPFATLLPWSVMYNYPPPQYLPKFRASEPSAWPPRAKPKFSSWRADTAQVSPPAHQIYIHVPFCPFICDFCPFYKVKSPGADVREQFTRTLISEIELNGRVPAAAEREYAVVYFGGGTPTELEPEQLARIMDALRRSFVLARDAEITLEGVARQMLRPGYLEGCFKAGFNRLSFGIQSLDERVRASIGRGEEDLNDYPRVLAAARAIRPEVPVNVEVLHGCPDQLDASVLADLTQLISWQVTSIDLFSYIMLPGTPLYRKVVKGEVSQPRYGHYLLNQRRQGKALLEENGYRQVAGEMFKRTGDRGLFSHSFYGSRGNATHNILALGPSAFGHLDGTVYRNVANLRQYTDLVAKELLPIGQALTMSREQARLRALLLAVAHLNIPRTFISTKRERNAVERWVDRGLVTEAADGWLLTPEGTLWYNQMQIELLPATDFFRNLRLLGSLEEQALLLSDGSPLGREILALATSYGGLPRWALKLGYHGYLGATRMIGGIKTQGIGWLGPAKRVGRVRDAVDA
jgi:oxygen-independent coproporphyrinogen-3 oxidase